jgi:hypothetical protein
MPHADASLLSLRAIAPPDDIADFIDFRHALFSPLIAAAIFTLRY